MDAPEPGTTMDRRAFFGRTLLALGGAGALIGLTGCPGGGGDDDDDGDDDGDDD